VAAQSVSTLAAQPAVQFPVGGHVVPQIAATWLAQPIPLQNEVHRPPEQPVDWAGQSAGKFTQTHLPVTRSHVPVGQSAFASH
jgi:hypothetical protein